MTVFATRQLIRETIIDELQVLPELLRKAEHRYYKALRRTQDSSCAGTTAERQAEADRFKIEVDYLRRKLETQQLMARLLAESPAYAMLAGDSRPRNIY